jgi:curli production assembly/transport component CsgG|tara:strand:+ start:511 stop:1362 length:852 start_codon:yes stop_codon:yes gene_type:complete
MIKNLILAFSLFFIAGCVSTPTYNSPYIQRPPYLIEQGEMKKMEKAPIYVAVYKFTDLTGQRKSTDNFASFSSAVTQGGEAWVIESLMEAGNGQWFKVVERAGLANLLNERNIIKNTQEDFSDKPPQIKPLLYAGILIEGGIISYESNIVSGGAGASYLGIGLSKQYRKDNVTVSMRMVSTVSGEVLLSSTVSKTILSVGLGGTLFKYFDTDKLGLGDFNEYGEAEIGFARNERVSMATRKAIDACIIDLVLQGHDAKLWKLLEPIPEPEVEPILDLKSNKSK